MDKPFEQLIDTLETKLTHLFGEHKKLKEEFSLLQKTLDNHDTEKNELVSEINDLKHQNSLLKNANALLGSDEFKRETKLKINALVKEIDQCIAQLS